MKIFQTDKHGNFIETEESPLSWMSPEPGVDECPFCSSYVHLRISLNRKGCTECGAQWKLKLGDIL